MRAQVNRVGAAWEYLEKEILVGRSFIPPVTTPVATPVAVSVSTPTATLSAEIFKERGLKKEWLDWIKERHKTQLDILMQTLNEKINIFEGKSSFITKLKRWDYTGSFKRATKDPNCGFEKDQRRMEERVELLIKAFKNLTPIDSELKLD